MILSSRPCNSAPVGTRDGRKTGILWAVVGEHMRFTTRENAHGYQYGLCLEVDPEAQTVTMDWYASERDYEERKVDSQKTIQCILECRTNFCQPS